MKKTVSQFKKGDQLSATKLNEMVSQGNRADNTFIDDANGISTSDVNLIGNRPPIFVQMVRIKSDTLPDTYSASGEVNEDDNNAVIQVWDDESNGWIDVQGQEIIVTPKDNLPLLENQKLVVKWENASHKWYPTFQEKVEIIRIPSGNYADSNGFYLGYLDRWDPVNLVWVEERQVYVKDANF